MIKKTGWLFLLFVLVLSCKEEDRSFYLPDSSGHTNSILIVISNDLWNSLIGEEIRKEFAQTLAAMPQEEPMYSLMQMPNEAFNTLVHRQRNFIEVKLSQQEYFEIANDTFAKPQTGVFVHGTSLQNLYDLIKENAEDIKRAVHTTELKDKQRRFTRGPLHTQSIKDSLQLDLTLPGSYRIAELTNDFVWMRRDIQSGSLNLLVYEMPLGYFDDEETRVQHIVKTRDSIGKQYIPGPLEGSYMGTEKAFAPYIMQTTLAGQPALEVRGIWDMQNYFMAGPFQSYILNDYKNNRTLVLEGLTFAPSIDKRDFQFELEAIIKTLRLLE